jgi:hypothetical protein
VTQHLKDETVESEGIVIAMQCVAICGNWFFWAKDIFCNPILFAFSTSTFSKMNKNVYNGMQKSAQ